MKRFALGYEYLARIVMMILVVNIAIIVHTIMGLVLGGFFPSVAASYATYRAWILNPQDRSWTVRQSWTIFHRTWKRELLAANLFGWPQSLIWLVLIWEYWFVQHNNLGAMGFAVSGVLLVLNLLYALFVLVSWAIRANFDEGPLWIVRTSFSMVVVRPLSSLVMLILLVVTVMAYYKWSGLMVAFGVSLPIFVVMMVLYSWAKIPGMDVHDIEPIEKDQRKRQADTRH
ncbi:MAG: YesL family protein [Bifidobacterium psychraerophilum]